MAVFDKRSNNVTKEMQVKELVERIPPILNVDILIYKISPDNTSQGYSEGTYLIGHRNKKSGNNALWRFPGGRVRYDESPQDAAERILKKEVPGVKAKLRKIITTVSDKGFDKRAYGVTIFFLFEYVSGISKVSEDFDKFLWGNSKQIIAINNVYWLSISVLNEADSTVRTMNSSQDELLVEVDKNNKEIGTIIKREAHSNPGRYHRAAHIMIFDTKGEVVLQQRSLTKATGAGMWDMHGGHQVAGQTIEQTAMQELAEEVGINIDLKLKRIKLFQDDKQSEYCYLFYGISDGPYGFDRNEVQKIKSFDCEKLLKHGYDKEYPILAHVYGYVEELRDIWKVLKKKKK